jgi:hypothetical protein
LRRNCLLKHVIEEKMGKDRVTGRRGRRHKQLLNDLKEKKGYWKFKELDRILLITRFRRGCALVVRETEEGKLQF